MGLCALCFALLRQRFAIIASIAGISSFLVAVFLLYSVTEQPFHSIGYIAFGALFATLYLPWFSILGRLGTKDAFICIFGSQVIASAFGALAAVLPSGIEALVFAICSLGSTICAIDANRNDAVPASLEVHYEKGYNREPIQYAILIVLFGISAGYFNQGDASSSFLNPHSYFAIWSIASALLSAGCIALVLKQRIEPNLNLVWRIFVVAILACLLGLQVFPDSPTGQAVINCIVCAFRTVVVCIFTVAMIDIARYAQWKPLVVLCTGYSISIASFLIPELVAIAVGAPLASFPSFWIGVFIVVSCSLLLVQEKDFSNARVFAELCSLPKSSTTTDSVKDRAHEVAKAFDLSNREEEVLCYLSMGRTRGYIAETLFISESTVASHSKRIYQKLSVHSKRELMDLVESFGS